MSGAADDGRLWWTMETDFDVAEFDKYEFNQKYVGPVAATVYKTSFTWRVALFPKGGTYNLGQMGEVRDHIGVGIQLVGGPIDDLDDVKYSVKVYKTDGELEVKAAPDDAVTINVEDWWGGVKGLPMARDHLRPYLLFDEEGVEYVCVRVEVGIPKTAFEPLDMLPPLPTPHEDMAERFSHWSGSNDLVEVVGGDGKKFYPYKGQLTEVSDVFKTMLETAMKEGNANCIRMDDLCGEALDELITFVTFGTTHPSRVRRHVLELLDVAQRYLLSDLKVICESEVVEKLQPKKLPTDVLKLLAAAETYELHVARNVGLCRLLNAFHQLSEADQDRFNSADFTAIRKRFTNLSTQSQLATKRQV